MSCYSKFVKVSAGKMSVLLLATAFFTLASMVADRANFSGEWKLNMSQSGLGQFGVGNKFCLDWLADQMRPKTMKIAVHTDFLIIDAACMSPGGTLVTRQEKLTFDGKESEVTLFGSTKKRSKITWSPGDQTMTVNSVIHLDIGPKVEEVTVTEIWKLIHAGKSIYLQSSSSSIFGENTMTLVYDRGS